MKYQIEIGKIERENSRVRDRVGRGYRGHRRGNRTLRLILSFLLAAGAAELTMAAVSMAASQTASSPDAAAQSSVKSTAQEWHPQIVVQVHNYAQVDANVLLGGEQLAADILREAGVDTVWLACSSGKGSHSDADCAKPLGPAHVSLNLPATAGSKRVQPADEVYGFAAGPNAWVFYNRVEESTQKLQLNTARILGNVIAHELGHILLGPNAHSSWGLMCARWSVDQLRTADRGGLGFSEIERAKIRSFVIASHRAQVSAQAQQAAELTTGVVAIAAPQTASSPDATAQSAVKSTAQDWHPQITLRVHNYSQIDARILLASEQIVSDILRKAGVDTVWLSCTSGEGSHSDAECAKSLGTTDLNLNFPVPSATKMYQRADSVYGFTLGNNAWVFFDRVKASALDYHLDTTHLLGNVIAHELGHLLLGDNAHSNWGLMRARWSPEQLRAADREELSFSDVERAKIRSFVMVSHQAQVSAQAQQAPDATSSTANNEISSLPGDGRLSK